MKMKGNGNESSMYWSWVYNHQRQDSKHGDGGIELWEPIEANPDRASESLFKQRDEDDQREDIINASLVKEIFKIATRREKEVIKLLQKGYNQNEVAKRLHIADSTAKTLVQRIRLKAQNIVVQKSKWGDMTRTRKLV